SRRRHTSFSRDWSSDVCSSDLVLVSLNSKTPKTGYSFGCESRKMLNYKCFCGAEGIRTHILFVTKHLSIIQFFKIISRKLLHLRSEERRVGKECRSRFRRWNCK